MPTKEETKQAVQDLLTAMQASEGAIGKFKGRCGAFGAEVAPLLKELLRPTAPWLVAATAFYHSATVIFESFSDRIGALTEAVHGSDLLARLRFAVDQSGAPSVADLEAATAVEPPSSVPEDEFDDQVTKPDGKPR